MRAPLIRGNSERGGIVARALVIFFLIGCVVLFLLARGCYKIVKESFQPKSVTSRSAADPNRFVFPVETCPDFPASEASEQRAAQAAARVPLIHGLIVDGVLSLKGKDIEGLSQFVSDDDKLLTYSYSGSGFTQVNGQVNVNKSFKTDPYSFCRSEIPSSHIYLGRMYDKHPSVFSAGTMHQLSTGAFDELKDSRTTRINLRTNAIMKSGKLAFNTDMFISLHRTDNGNVTFHVIVNGDPSDLPVITADGVPSSGTGILKFAALDDAAFPLILNWDWAGDANENKVVKITYPVEKKIEKDLAEEGRAEIYGIYFDFDSADIRSESEPVLAEIAEALKRNPAWKLSVEGHTDNVGGDKHNLDLSQRRASSVIEALVSRYQISESRLVPAGFGASKPKASNDTVDGRALNRRVELVRK